MRMIFVNSTTADDQTDSSGEIYDADQPIDQQGSSTETVVIFPDDESKSNLR